MTELSFLLELLLEHELTKETKTLIKERIKFIEVNQTPSYPIQHQPRIPNNGQAASTQRILDEMAQEKMHAPIVAQQIVLPDPNQIAQTPATAAAMAARNEAIRIATSGREEKGRVSPRKF